MSKLKKVKRSKLSKMLNALNFKPMQFFVTSFRATANGSLQVEVCQNRRLGGRKRTLLGMVNRSDKRFGGDTTLLFDWLVFKPADLLAVFPTLAKEYTVEQLEELADSYDENGKKGKDAIVFAALHSIDYLMDPVDQEQVHPVIAVTEITEAALLNGEFYRGDNADEKIANEIQNGNSVMRTGSEDDADFIVDSASGEKVYRFTQTQMQEDFPNQDWDSMIANKMTQTQYEKGSKKASKAYAKIEDLEIPAIQGDDSI